MLAQIKKGCVCLFFVYVVFPRIPHFQFRTYTKIRELLANICAFIRNYCALTKTRSVRIYSQLFSFLRVFPRIPHFQFRTYTKIRELLANICAFIRNYCKNTKCAHLFAIIFMKSIEISTMRNQIFFT